MAQKVYRKSNIEIARSNLRNLETTIKKMGIEDATISSNLKTGYAALRVMDKQADEYDRAVSSKNRKLAKQIVQDQNKLAYQATSSFVSAYRRASAINSIRNSLGGGRGASNASQV